MPNHDRKEEERLKRLHARDRREVAFQERLDDNADHRRTVKQRWEEIRARKAEQDPTGERSEWQGSVRDRWRSIHDRQRENER